MNKACKEYIIRNTRKFVKQQMEHDASGHDWWHIYRVTKLAMKLAVQEHADLFICELASLLHDIADEKLNPSKEIGLLRVNQWLLENEVPIDQMNHIQEIIATMSFQGGHHPPMRTLEGRIVQDADRLDAMGAIGIARTFAYGGWKGQLMHEPGLAPRENTSIEEYRQGKSTAINHFYEKLFKLKERMNTASAIKIAAERHQFMVDYLEHFYAEWEANVE